MKEIKRNPGIDFLRLLAMYLVVVYHLLFHGGILDAGRNSGAAQLLRVLTLCAVDSFALISGYVGLREEKPRFPVNRMARLWLQTLFYSLLMLLAAACVYRPILSKSSLLRALLPVASDQYWYVTAYMPLCLMMPWLNALLYRLDRRELGQLAAGLTGLFCLYGTLANPLSENFRLWGGCHFSWLVILYVVGAALGRDGWLEKLKTIWVAAAFLGCWACLWLTNRFGVLSGFQLERNSSHLVLAMAVCLMALCTRIRFSTGLQRVLARMAPAAFGVYLMHDNPAFRQVFISGRFAFLARLPAWAMIGAVLFAALVIFLLGILVDSGRMRLFSLLRKKDL